MLNATFTYTCNTHARLQKIGISHSEATETNKIRILASIYAFELLQVPVRNRKPLENSVAVSFGTDNVVLLPGRLQRESPIQ